MLKVAIGHSDDVDSGAAIETVLEHRLTMISILFLRKSMTHIPV